jgi:hypothetical protein
LVAEQLDDGRVRKLIERRSDGGNVLVMGARHPSSSPYWVTRSARPEPVPLALLDRVRGTAIHSRPARYRRPMEG